MNRLLPILMMIGSAAVVHTEVVFTPPEWVFGEIESVTPLELICKIENSEEQTLQVRILPTCGCLSAEPSELSISSGGQTEITLYYDPVDDSGAVEHFFIIQTNLEALRKALFSVRGTVSPPAEEKSPETELK